MPNAELGWRIYDLSQILPHRLKMRSWVNWLDRPWVYWQDRPYKWVSKENLLDPESGMSGCLAAWTVTDAGYQIDRSGNVRLGDDVFNVDAGELATEILEINSLQKERLFFCSDEDVDARMREVFGSRP